MKFRPGKEDREGSISLKKSKQKERSAGILAKKQEYELLSR